MQNASLAVCRKTSLYKGSRGDFQPYLKSLHDLNANIVARVKVFFHESAELRELLFGPRIGKLLVIARTPVKVFL
jgi:hypothetical protein